MYMYNNYMYIQHANKCKYDRDCEKMHLKIHETMVAQIKYNLLDIVWGESEQHDACYQSVTLYCASQWSFV